MKFHATKGSTLMADRIAGHLALLSRCRSMET